MQVLAPRLEISDRKFVIPANYAADGGHSDPEAIVKQERRMQLASAIFTASGAMALAFLYRGVLFSKSARNGTARAKVPHSQGC